MEVSRISHNDVFIGLKRVSTAGVDRAIALALMNTNKFSESRDCFALLDLMACFDFKTETSISFQIGKRSKDGCIFSVRGWLDIHHPVDMGEYAKAYLRISLPQKYLDFEQEKLILAVVFEALEIPEQEIYEAYFFTSENTQHLFAEEPGVMYTYAS